jgi:hypothetical protein
MGGLEFGICCLDGVMKDGIEAMEPADDSAGSIRVSA